VDPIVKEHESPFAAFANNPIWFIDPLGADTSFADASAKVGVEKYTEQTITKTSKKGKETTESNPNYSPGLASIVKQFEDNKDVEVVFTTDVSKFEDASGVKLTGEHDGAIGIDAEGKYWVYFTDNISGDALARGGIGTSLFEESYHMKDAIEGCEFKMVYDDEYKRTVTIGLDVYDEVNAKIWAADNQKVIDKYVYDSNTQVQAEGYTTFGFIKANKNDPQRVAAFLQNPNIRLDAIVYKYNFDAVGTMRKYKTEEQYRYTPHGAGVYSNLDSSPTQP
jgi:hypothetical protein